VQKSKTHIHDHIVIGAGVSGCNIAHKLNKHSNNILVIEKENKIAFGASGAAGGFLSPLLGKPNKFKDLVNEALIYSTEFYKKNMPNLINQCGTLRLPKNKEDEDKFKSYIPFIDFQYKLMDGGCFFPYASVVKSYEICKALIANISIQYNCEIKSIKYENNIWILDDLYHTRNLILSTGASSSLIKEFYLNIRAVWGQRIDVHSSTCISHNYHKECSISYSNEISEDKYLVSIGATHNRVVSDLKMIKDDTKYLIEKANDIIELNDVEVVNIYNGARAASVDYFPLVGKIIDSSKTIEEFPYLKNGTNVKENRFTRYDNLYILNGVGGRGFVLAPYLANELCELIINDIDVREDINLNRLFKREVKRLK